MKKQCSNCKWWTEESSTRGKCVGLPPPNTILSGIPTRPDAFCSLWKRNWKKALKKK